MNDPRKESRIMPGVSTEFYQPVMFARVFKANDVERVRAVRLYHAAPGDFALQVRAPATNRNHREGKDFLIATASLSITDLRALRDSINTILGEAE